MHFLIATDELRSHAIFSALIILFCVAVLAILTPRMKFGLPRTTRPFGAFLFAVLAILLLTGFVDFDNPPRKHMAFNSPNGAKVALLSHSSNRDGAATRVTMRIGSCCRQVTLYDYYGDGDDYMGINSVTWVDDHHIAIQYAIDESGEQKCYPGADDMHVSCDPQPIPFPAQPTELNR